MFGVRFKVITNIKTKFIFSSGYIQIEICPEEIGNNVPATVGLHGTVDAILQQVLSKSC